jgi:hypothetical protein
VPERRGGAAGGVRLVARRGRRGTPLAADEVVVCIVGVVRIALRGHVHPLIAILVPRVNRRVLTQEPGAAGCISDAGLGDAPAGAR